MNEMDFAELFLLPTGRVEVDAAHRAVDEDLEGILLGSRILTSTTPTSWIYEDHPGGTSLADRLEPEFGAYDDQTGPTDTHQPLLDYVVSDPARAEIRHGLLVEAAHFFVDSLESAVQWAVQQEYELVKQTSGDPSLLLQFHYDDSTGTYLEVVEEARRQLAGLANAAGVLTSAALVARFDAQADARS